MHWLIGLDEAGYGPNLGPLAIGVTAWQLADASEPNLYKLLSEAITDGPTKDARLAIADSKQLYKPRGGLALLERSVLAALGRSSLSWTNLLSKLQADQAERRFELPWHEGFEVDLPVDTTAQPIDQSIELLEATTTTADVSIPKMMARLVFPAEFNELVEQHGTKGAALSETTIGLIRSMIDQQGLVDQTDVTFAATLDKHGGRNRYADLLQEQFPEHLVAPLVESRPESRYQWGPHTFCFRSKGEAEAPVALASMIAKLLRELSMKAFNQYWQSHLHNLKPTAGYPVDAKRFRSEIVAKQRELKIEDHKLWRSR